MDLNGLLSVITGASKATEATREQLAAGFGTVKAEQQAQADAVQAAVKPAQIVQLQEDQAKQTAQQNSLRAATSLGTNMSDVSEIMTLLGGNMRQAAIDTQKQNKLVQNLEAGVADWNPIALVTDLLFGDGERAKADTLAKNFERTSAQFNALNTATQTVTATQNAIAQTKSDASIAAAQDLIARKADVESAQIKERMAGVDIQQIQAFNNLDSQQLDLATKGYNARVQEEQRQLQRAQIALQNAMRAEAAEDRRERAAERSELNKQRLQEKRIDEIHLENFNAGRQKFGLPAMSETEFRSAWKYGQDEQKAQMSFFAGAGSQMRAGMPVHYGPDPITAVSRLAALKSPIPETQAQLVKKITGTLASVTPQQLLDRSGLSPMDRAAVQGDKKKMQALAESYVKGQTEEWRRVIKPGDSTNPYSLPTLNALKGERYLETNPFLRDVFAPLVSNASPVAYDPSFALKTAVEQGVKSGKYTTAQMAEGLSWVSNKLKMDLNTTTSFQSFGMAPLDKVNMPVVVDFGRFAQYAGTFDTSSATAWTKAIVDATGKSRTIKEALRNNNQSMTEGFLDIFGFGSSSTYMQGPTTSGKISK